MEFKIRTPWQKSWFFKEFYYEINDAGIRHTVYTKIFLLNWLLSLHDFIAKSLGSISSSRGFFRWKDVVSYKIFEKEKAILVSHTITYLIPKYVWVVCNTNDFEKVKKMFINKVGKSKQLTRVSTDKFVFVNKR